MLFCRVDPETGLWAEDVLLDAPPVNEAGEPDPAYIAMPCPEGFYLPRWDGEQWLEGKTPEEIAAIRDTPTEPTPQAQWRTDIENALVELAGLITGGE